MYHLIGHITAHEARDGPATGPRQARDRPPSQQYKQPRSWPITIPIRLRSRSSAAVHARWCCDCQRHLSFATKGVRRLRRARPEPEALLIKKDASLKCNEELELGPRLIARDLAQGLPGDRVQSSSVCAYPGHGCSRSSLQCSQSLANGDDVSLYCRPAGQRSSLKVQPLPVDQVICHSLARFCELTATQGWCYRTSDPK